MLRRPRRPGGMMRRCCAAALLLAGSTAAAQPVPGLGMVDSREPVPADRAPWNAVALVETEAEGRCTGVMLGERLLLTAAHCLVRSDARALVAPREIRVRLGGETARATALRSGAGFVPAREEPWRADWALLTLDRPIGAGRTLPLMREPPRQGAPLMLPAWQHDRPDVLLADRACHVVTIGTFGAQGILVGHNCAGTTGSSGAPLIARSGGGYAVAGVQVKAALGRPLGVAVPGFTIPAPTAR